MRLIQIIAGPGVTFQSVSGNRRNEDMLEISATKVAQVILYVLLTVALRTVGVGADLLDWSEILLVQGLAIILTSIPITPGSVGVAALVYIGFFNLITNGAAPNEIAAGVILYRLATWLMPIPIGWIVTLRWQSRHGRRQLG